MLSYLVSLCPLTRYKPCACVHASTSQARLLRAVADLVIQGELTLAERAEIDYLVFTRVRALLLFSHPIVSINAIIMLIWCLQYVPLLRLWRAAEHRHSHRLDVAGEIPYGLREVLALYRSQEVGHN